MLKELLFRAWPGVVAAGVLAGLGAIAWTEKKEKDAAIAQSTKSEMEARRTQSELDERLRVVARLQAELERVQRAPTQAKESPERDSDVARQLAAMSQRIKEQDVKLDALQSERDQLKRALERQRSTESAERANSPPLAEGSAPNPPSPPTRAPARQIFELRAGSPVVVDQIHTITLSFTRSYGGQFVINGQKHSSQQVGGRISLPAASGKKCFLEVMTLSPETATPNTARLDYVC